MKDTNIQCPKTLRLNIKKTFGNLRYGNGNIQMIYN